MELKDLGKFGRMSVLTWPILVGALVLASCGNDATSGATASTINLDATNYIVKEPVTTTIAPLSVVEETSTGSQTYVVESGDYAIKVAEQFGVPLEDLLNFNGWATGSEFPFPGEEIKIPPGGTAQEGAAADADDAASAGETIPDAGSNCAPGSYTIEAGDTARSKVANKFDVTVDALDAANAGTSGYSAFYPGLKIVIPAKADC